MKNYGSTISSLYKLLAEKAEGVRICDFKNIDKKVDIYEESGSTIFFHFDHLRGVVFDVDTDHPYISKTFYVWNNVYDDWDEVTFEKDIPLKPNKIIEETPERISIVVMDNLINSINIISTTTECVNDDVESWLEHHGYSLSCSSYMVVRDGELYINHKTIED